MIVGESPRDANGFELVASADEVRRMDHAAMSELGVEGLVLMELAGAAAARAIRVRLGGLSGKAVILCGAGNNGGDGYVVARHLAMMGFAVRTLALAEPRAGTDADTNRRIWQRLLEADAQSPAPRHEHRVAERGATARMRHFLGHANVIVDALFGTGLTRPLEGAALELVMAANEAQHGLKVALDLPSGLCASTGRILGDTIAVDLTVTFGAMKRGLLLGDGPRVAGEVEVVAIWPTPAIEAVGASMRRATVESMARLVPHRSPEGHKGTFGHVAVLGGVRGMDGAAILSARGAARSGAGLVTWVAPRSMGSLAVGSQADGTLEVERPPELMRADWGPGAPLPTRANVLVCGPGLGRSEDARALWEVALSDARPVVLDADGLNLLSEAPRTRERWILTPHPLEAARLLGTSVEVVQADRVAAAQTLADRYGAVVILKGARSLVAAPTPAAHVPVLVDVAEPALAVGGSGDVLAGLVGGLMAQGLGDWDAALLGTWTHAHAGRDAGLGQGSRGVFASEIADRVPAVLSELEASR